MQFTGTMLPLEVGVGISKRELVHVQCCIPVLSLIEMYKRILQVYQGRKTDNKSETKGKFNRTITADHYCIMFDSPGLNAIASIMMSSFMCSSLKDGCSKSNSNGEWEIGSSLMSCNDWRYG